jgi:4-amino-4-deoxy-L-arabinose transferase-like glycosyltransferase
MRFWSATAGVVTVMLIYVWVLQATRAAWAGAAAAIVFLCGRFIFFHSFRTGETDGLLVAAMTAALYAYWRWWENRRWWMLAGFFIGLVWMIKPMFGIFPLGIIGLDLLASRSLTKVRVRDGLLILAASLMIAAPWHIAIAARFGQSFWDAYIGFNVLQRAGDTLYHNLVPWWWYAKIIAMRFFPFVALLPLTVITLIPRLRTRGASLERLLVIWAGGIFLSFTLIQTKFDWYVLPLYPALAIAIAVAMKIWWEKKDIRIVRAIVVSLGVAWIMIGGKIDLTGPIRFITPFAYAPITWPRLVVALVLPVLLLIVLRTKRGGVYRVQIGLASLVLMLSLGAWWAWSEIRHLPTTSPAKDLAAMLQQKNIHTVDVVGVDLRTYPNIYFYLLQAGIQIHEGATFDPSHTTILPLKDARGTIVGEVRVLEKTK